MLHTCQTLLAMRLQVPAAYLSNSSKSQPGEETAADANSVTESMTTASDLQDQAVPDAAQPLASSADSPNPAPAADDQQEYSNGAASTVIGGSPADEWLLFNDFAISPAESDDVRRLYGAQKVPVVLYFRQVRPRTMPAPSPQRCIAWLSSALSSNSYRLGPVITAP